MEAKYIVLIPAYEPDRRLVALVESLADEYETLVVDDGSADMCAGVFALAEKAGATVLRHEVNRGKGAAIKTGLRHILCREDVSGVITADADGQHTREDIARIASEMERYPDDLVLGCRDFTKMPPRSRFGNTVTRFAFRLATGLDISDTQTGLRGLPRSLFERLIALPGERYEYEMNMLTALDSWCIGYAEITIETIYIDNNSSSHFHAIRDGLRVFSRLGKFMLSSLASTVLDYALFYLAIMLGLIPAASYIIGKAASGIVNYEINRRVVFKSGGGAVSVAGYIILASVVTLIGSLLVTLLVKAGMNELLSKLAVDIPLFFVNYAVQKRVVFRRRSNGAGNITHTHKEDNR